MIFCIYVHVYRHNALITNDFEEVIAYCRKKDMQSATAQVEVWYNGFMITSFDASRALV